MLKEARYEEPTLYYVFQDGAHRLHYLRVPPPEADEPT